MSWLFSQALVAAYSGAISSDGEPSAPLSGNLTQLAYLSPDKMTDFSRLSRFGLTFRPLTDDLGEAVLMSYLEAFPARTSAQPEKEQELQVNGQECGFTWPESWARYDQSTSSWKTRQCSLLGGLEPYSETWPRWGTMRDGEFWGQEMLALHTNETESGLWPTPNSRDWKDTEPTQGKRKNPNLGASVRWPTPRTAGMCGGSGAWELLKKNTTIEEARAMGSGNGGSLNPPWVEWLMGWPIGWTELKPLEMDKYHYALQPLGDC